MPKAFEQDGFVFSFWSNEGLEPMHVHVSKGDAGGKWWLGDLTIVYATGFNPNEIRKIRRILRTRRKDLIDAWTKHFSRPA